MLLVEEAKGMDEDKGKEEAGGAGVVVAHNSNNRYQFIPRQESHMSILWKKDHGTDANRKKCPNYDPTLKTSEAQVAAAAAAEAAGAASNAGTPTSDAWGDTHPEQLQQTHPRMKVCLHLKAYVDQEGPCDGVEQAM
eukprot:15320989-Ditylum_brightwellii.AAC.1